jgi:RNA polymerase primary sigma factor
MIKATLMRQLRITKQFTNRESKAVDQYLTDVSNIPMIDPGEEVKLSQRIKEGDMEALDRLVRANLRFVISVAKQYQNRGLALGDLINEGNIGLIKAAMRFDETRGFKFISYAVWWIRQSIMQATAEHGRLVRMPLNRITTLTQINNISATLEQQKERTPVNEEIAKELEVPLESIDTTLKGAGQTLSLEAPLTEEEEGSLLNVMPDDQEPSPDSELIIESLEKEMKTLLNHLKPKEQAILGLYYGLNGYKRLSLDEIGQELELTRERVRQLRDRALRRLQKTRDCQKLQQYL